MGADPFRPYARELLEPPQVSIPCGCRSIVAAACAGIEYRDALRNSIDQAKGHDGLLVHLADYLDGKLNDMPAVQ